MNVTLVPYGSLTRFLPMLYPHFVTSEIWSHGRAEVDDIVGFLYSGRMQLWVFFAGDKETPELAGHMITEVKDYPRCKMLVLQYCAAETGTMEPIEGAMHETLERFAKDMGCKGIEFVGRPGWARSAKAHGYTSKTITYEKFFE